MNLTVTLLSVMLAQPAQAPKAYVVAACVPDTRNVTVRRMVAVATVTKRGELHSLVEHGAHAQSGEVKQMQAALDEAQWWDSRSGEPITHHWVHRQDSGGLGRWEAGECDSSAPWTNYPRGVPPLRARQRDEKRRQEAVAVLGTRGDFSRLTGWSSRDYDSYRGVSAFGPSKDFWFLWRAGEREPLVTWGLHETAVTLRLSVLDPEEVVAKAQEVPTLLVLTERAPAESGHVRVLIAALDPAAPRSLEVTVDEPGRATVDVHAPLVGDLSNGRPACGCRFENGEGTPVFFRGLLAGDPAIMRLRGGEVQLRGRGDDLSAPPFSVKVRVHATTPCPEGDQECEAEDYAGTITVTDGRVTEKVAVKGRCGC